MSLPPIDRRRLAALGLAALWPPGTLHAGTARTTVPPFSGAALGARTVDGWQHQRLPKVERANEHEIVADETGTPVLQIRSTFQRQLSTYILRPISRIAPPKTERRDDVAPSTGGRGGSGLGGGGGSGSGGGGSSSMVITVSSCRAALGAGAGR